MLEPVVAINMLNMKTENETLKIAPKLSVSRSESFIFVLVMDLK